MSCRGIHCPGCGDGGGGALLAIVVLAVIIAAVARPAEHALAELVHVVLIIAASAAAAAVAAAGAWLAVCIRRRRRIRAALPARQRTVIAGRVLPERDALARQLAALSPAGRAALASTLAGRQAAGDGRERQAAATAELSR